MPDESLNFPLVSIITVTYNSGKYVRATLTSVLALEYQNIEYIIADDCSKDDTWSIISEFKDARIKAFRNEVNIGEYNNRNKAIGKASGKYLIFIDGDDIIFPHAIGSFVGYMEKFPDACMAIQKGYYNNLVYPFLLKPKQQYINYFFGSTSLLVSSFASNFFRTDLLQQFMLSTSYKSGDDEIRLRLASRYPVLYVPGWMSWPRETPGQASSKIPTDVALLQLREYLKKILAEENIISADKDLAKAIGTKLDHTIARTIKQLLMKGQIAKAREFAKKAGFGLLEVLNMKLPSFEYTDFMVARTPDNPYMVLPDISNLHV